VVVDDFDVVGVAADPAEADSKLVVDADAVLTEAVTGEFFKSIGGWDLQIGEGSGGIKHDELAESNTVEIGWETTNFLALEEAFGVVVAKTANHGT